MNSDNNIINKNFLEEKRLNLKLIEKFKNLKIYFEKIKKIEEIKKKDVLGLLYSFDENLNKLFDTFEINLDKLIELTNKIIENLNKEKKILTKDFHKITTDSGEQIKRLNQLIINSTDEQQTLIQELNAILPNILTIGEKIIGIEDGQIYEFAEKISYYIETILKEIKEITSIDNLLINFESLILTLDKTENYLAQIIKKLNSKDKLIIKNYSKNKKILNKKIIDLRIKSKRNQTNAKGYYELKNQDIKIYENLLTEFKELFLILFKEVQIHNISASKLITELFNNELNRKN